MRFGKRNRNWVAAGRRLLGDRREVEGEAIATEERNALIGNDLEEEMLVPEPDLDMDIEVPEAPDPPEQPQSVVAGDPTQHLLTALGRFHRQVAKAAGGAPQSAWSDECMNQLITGIEISLGQEWVEIQEALTDTARLLQSYEEHERAPESVPFLQDSYEILCLMVGDLMVDNIRSGVMKKWRNRYELAVEELIKTGLSLVEDDSESAAPEAPPQPDDAAEPAEDDVSAEVEAAEVEGGEASADATDMGHIIPFSLPGEEPAEAEDSANLPTLDELLADSEEDTEAAEAFTAPEPEELPELESVEDGEGEDLEAFEEPADATPILFETPEAPAEAAVEEVAEAPSEDPPAPEAEAEAAPENAEQLLRTAQEAIAGGKLADAKVLALRLAANVAQLEADEAAATVQRTEDDVAGLDTDVGNAEAAVQSAMEHLQSAENNVTACNETFEGKREETAASREAVSAVEEAITDLDRQLAELQAKREEETEHLAMARECLEEALAEESRLQTELDTLSEAEASARNGVEENEYALAELRTRRTSMGEALVFACENLEQQRHAASEIAETLTQLSGKKHPKKAAAEDGGSMLF